MKKTTIKKKIYKITILSIVIFVSSFFYTNFIWADDFDVTDDLQNEDIFIEYNEEDEFSNDDEFINDDELNETDEDLLYNGWYEIDNKFYWYENGVRQGVKYNENGTLDSTYRGKEIYDPESDAWYWLDNIQFGAKAVDKDVYQESLAGPWGDALDEEGQKIGKWVRYDKDGHMIKGWQNIVDANGKISTFYFDEQYGTMAKGLVEIENQLGLFDATTGIAYNGWFKQDGLSFWYEAGIRQGYIINDDTYRGKEIYDPASKAWYWLDNVQKGAMATNKDVYQETLAGEWGESVNENGQKIGKWVRYNEFGQMVKGWNYSLNGDLYFMDPVYGTMAKGEVKINGYTFVFDKDTGIIEKKPEKCIVFFGDSMIQGIGAGIAVIKKNNEILDISGYTCPSTVEHLTDMCVMNLGVAGETSKQIMDRAVKFYKQFDGKNDILVLEMGSNGGWSNYEELITQYKTIIKQSRTKKYLVLGDTDDPELSYDNRQKMMFNDLLGTKETLWEKELLRAFGENAFNTRVYMLVHGLSDCNLAQTENDKTNAKKGIISKQLRHDWTHLNSYGYYSKGLGVYNKLKSLKYI